MITWPCGGHGEPVLARPRQPETCRRTPKVLNVIGWVLTSLQTTSLAGHRPACRSFDQVAGPRRYGAGQSAGLPLRSFQPPPRDRPLTRSVPFSCTVAVSSDDHRRRTSWFTGTGTLVLPLLTLCVHLPRSGWLLVPDAARASASRHLMDFEGPSTTAADAAEETLLLGCCSPLVYRCPSVQSLRVPLSLRTYLRVPLALRVPLSLRTSLALRTLYRSEHRQARSRHGQPTNNDSRPTTNDSRPTPTDQRQPTNTDRPTTADQHRQQTDHRQKTDHRQTTCWTLPYVDQQLVNPYRSVQKPH